MTRKGAVVTEVIQGGRDGTSLIRQYRFFDRGMSPNFAEQAGHRSLWNGDGSMAQPIFDEQNRVPRFQSTLMASGEAHVFRVQMKIKTSMLQRDRKW